MNKYQRAKDKVIRQIVASDKFGRISYKQARRIVHKVRKVWVGTPDGPVLIMVRHHGRSNYKQMIMDTAKLLGANGYGTLDYH